MLDKFNKIKWSWLPTMKINIAKTLSGDFKVTTPENPLLSQQAVTSK